jgi:tetratricopeptide (TPR) repeat protein
MPLFRKTFRLKIGVIFILFFFSSTDLFAQESNTDLQNWTSLNELLAMNLKFPRAELRDEKLGRVIISMKIDEMGRPDSIFLIEGAGESFNAEVLRVIDLATTNWKPEFLENRPAGNEYLWVISFKASMDGNMFPDEFRMVDNLLKKEKFDKAIEFCTEKIAENPYQYLWYEKRADAYRQAGNAESGQRDFMAAKQVKRKVLAEAEVKAFGKMKVDQGVPGSIRGTSF